MDDREHFVEDKLLMAPDGLYRIWFHPDPSIWNYWPITRTSFWIERHLWGINGPASHGVNICLHSIAVVIVYLGLRRFGVPGAWFVAGLFALHPIFAESVAWVTQRKNVLSGVFYLLSTWSYLHFDSTRKRTWYGCSLILFLCALLSKSSTVMLPVILIFCRLALGRRWARKDFALLAPFFLLSIMAAWGSVWFEEHHVGSRGPEFSQGFAERIAVAGRIPWFYLLKILVPYPLAFIYPKWKIESGALLEYVPALGVVAIAAILLMNYSRWSRLPCLGLGAFMVTLFPVLGFFDIHGMKYSYVANHWAYLPALPILVLVGGGLGAWLRDFRTVRGIAFGTILAILGPLTWLQSRTFKDSETLWNDTIAKNPSCWLAHVNLSAELLAQERTEEALAHSAEALRINPEFKETHNFVGLAFLNQGRVDKAIEQFREALQSNPLYDEAYLNLGIAMEEKGRIEEAIEQYSMALRINPRYEKAHNNLGLILETQGRIDEAIEHFLEALRLHPEQASTHYNLGNTYRRQGRADSAIEQYLEALRIDSNFEDAHNNLGALLFQSGNAEAAIRHFREALRIKPDFADAKRNLEIALQGNQEAD